MSDPYELESIRPPGARRGGSAWLWLLAIVVLLGAPTYILLANLADEHDAVGIDFTFGECPSDAGSGGGDETAELAADPGPFAECTVAANAPVFEVKDVNLVILKGPETGDRPIMLVRGQGGDPMEVAGGDLVEVQGTARASLDAAVLEERFDTEPGAYAEFDGEPFISVKRLEVTEPAAG